MLRGPLSHHLLYTIVCCLMTGQWGPKHLTVGVLQYYRNLNNCVHLLV